jgi:hypothetical protein
MYGGELQDREVSFTLGQLKKQQCAIKVNKRPPVVMTVDSIPDIDVTSKVLKDFKARLYNSPFYQSPKAAREEINNRFAVRTYQAQPASPDFSRSH